MFQDYAELKPGRQFSDRIYTPDSDMVAGYVRAVQDANPPVLDESGREVVPPMAVAALGLRGAVEDLRIPGGTLHAGQEFAFFSAVRAGDSLRCEASVSQNSVRGGWRFLVVECTATDGGGAQVMSGKSSLMIPADLPPREGEATP